MPDKRRHRGPHPDDRRLFAPERLATIRLAAAEYAWLLTRGYADKSALKLVGDRHGLEARQRMAIWRTVCSDPARDGRAVREVPLAACAKQAVGVDGYNVLVTVESALSGGMVLIGRDGCCRDLASVHGTYRKVDETRPAIELVAGRLVELGVARVDWYLDKPVSNSGRLKTLMAELLEARGWLELFNIELGNSPDRVLADYAGVVVTADGPVLDRCGRWTNLVGEIVAALPEAWVVDICGEQGTSCRGSEASGARGADSSLLGMARLRLE